MSGMILVLGATGYIGRAFVRELRRRGWGFIPLARGAFDYSQKGLLLEYVRKTKPEFLINAAGYSGRPNVDSCEEERMATFQANTVLPQTVAQVCMSTNTPWGHVSSGCIYSGARVFENGRMRIERDLNEPSVRRLFETHPERFFGFTESEEPNLSFRAQPCSFFGGTKALAEEALQDYPQCYIWRPRLPFSEVDEPGNLLSKLQRYPKVYDHVTSVSHVGDFVRACLDLWERRGEFGTYNVTNPGAITTRRVVELIQRFLGSSRQFDYWADDDEFYTFGARAPRSSAVLDVSKLLSTGIKLRPVEEALTAALMTWRLALRPGPRVEAVTTPLLFPSSWGN